MNHLITILGPTATGKTMLAANLASLISGEIISADSRQIYRRMDIGTGKDLGDYVVDGKHIPYHLIDIADPGFRYNVFEFLNDFSDTFYKVAEAGNIPILCGGSGMYLDAVLRGYQMSNAPVNNELRKLLEELSHAELVSKLATYGPLHNISDISESERLIRAIEIADFQVKYKDLSLNLPDFTPINFGIFFERKIIRYRITERLEARINKGLVSEVEALIESGIKPENLIYYGLEYKFVTLFVTGQLSFESMFTQLNTAIHQFAKRQMTWYRRMEKNGVKIHWIDGSIDLADKLAVILSRINF
ncbi:MAG: tRNA (adenosine(37)-N6)-dimethylallyltransferase MiaA [Bacteroidetes bacterium]|nr:tRNA (adenosine(37)-N6)-dimethylallyltransferase MiaA [Bacteroidota bacterium]MBL6943983.1 tRNA (adenosine(37)-N6)-dimethylallyltransferase MiaA [Bacteroidales bacterium]